jgi:hypothetical protein
MAFAHASGWQAPSGNILKAVATGNGPRFGAYAVRFSGPDEKDLSGEYFTSETDFGPNYGDGSAVLIHHGRPLAEGLEAFASVILPAAKVNRHGSGLFASTQLDLEDPLHAAIAELITSGAFRWSSGSRTNLVRREADGRIVRWPPLEFSLTPTPAEPRLPRLRLI